MSIENISSNKSFGGWHKQYSHRSAVLNCDMRFAIYLPPQVSTGDTVPVLYWLSGLTCTDENFMQKSGAQAIAAELGIEANFPVSGMRSISGHSMGGHGALTIALKNPLRYQSVSAFSPISNPINCPWGQKAFTQYLGDDKSQWRQHDASELMRNARQFVPARVEQGNADQFLEEQLKPETLTAAANASAYPLELNSHDGYDHSYYFIASFIEEHLRFHAVHLQG